MRVEINKFDATTRANTDYLYWSLVQDGPSLAMGDNLVEEPTCSFQFLDRVGAGPDIAIFSDTLLFTIVESKLRFEYFTTVVGTRCNELKFDILSPLGVF